MKDNAAKTKKFIKSANGGNMFIVKLDIFYTFCSRDGILMVVLNSGAATLQYCNTCLITV